MFRRRIGGDADAALEAEQRGDVDDAGGGAAVEGGFREGLGQQEDGLEVDVHHVVPIGLGIIHAVGAADDAGVVDEDVERAERGDLGGDVRGGGKVHEDGLSGAARGLDLRDGLVTGAATGGEDMGAGLGQTHGDGLTDAGVGTGDEGALAVDAKVHLRSPMATWSISVKSTLSPAIAQQKV